MLSEELEQGRQIDIYTLKHNENRSLNRKQFSDPIFYIISPPLRSNGVSTDLVSEMGRLKRTLTSDYRFFKIKDETRNWRNFLYLGIFYMINFVK